VTRLGRAVALALLAAGCSGIDLGDAARRDTAEALQCPSEEVALEQLGEYRYRGDGCGREVVVACTASALEPRCFPQSMGGDAQEQTAEPPPDVEATIRGGLEARRDDVLACVGRARVGVRAAYTGEGVVSLSLQGDLADTPEEACVRDALGGVRVAATGEEGVIIHLVD